MIGLRAQPRSTFVEAAPRFTFSAGPKYQIRVPIQAFAVTLESVNVRPGRSVLIAICTYFSIP